ncbi:MAG: Ig-like domain-containing protein, partial [Rivularia sp. ALOHA_DT_140]|nr:Ig-like domain-containing protein [Rivularia sp. ALOHA_DT_140]
TDIQISSDFGTSNNDKRTNTTNFNISGSLGETGLTVFLKNKTTNQDLGQATVTDTTFNLEVELSSAGNHQIEVQLVDAAGNTTTSDFEVFADLIVPTVSQILNLPQQSVTTPIDFVDVVFSEAIDPSSFDHQDISLTRDGGQNLITDSVSIYAISETKYRIQGLTDLTTTPGSYRLVINTNNIDDTAGNSGNSLFENIFSIIEEPQPGIIITESGNITNVSETGSTDNYTVVLNTQPASQVTITINTDNQITTDKTTLTFNTDNWDTPQTVTVSAVNDAEGEELQQSIISHVVSSDDSNYDQISLGNITVNVEDNDAQIQGIAWNDQNGNAIQDTDEPGLEGWTIYLDDNNNGQLDTNETSTFTDANGNYNFTSLTPGNYTVAQVLQSGWQQTFPEVNITTTASDEKIYTPSEPEFTSSSLTTPADELINLDDFRSDTRFTDITGNGFATVIIDTGIDLDHPVFGADNAGDGIAARIVYQYDFADNDSDA